MADEDDGNIFGGQLAHDIQKSLRFFSGQRGRGLVHEYDPRIGGQHAADGDDLALGDAQIAKARVRIKANADPRDDFFRSLT